MGHLIDFALMLPPAFRVSRPTPKAPSKQAHQFEKEKGVFLGEKESLDKELAQLAAPELPEDFNYFI
eukprot:8908104-Pyramimonas_sp.AAC.1